MQSGLQAIVRTDLTCLLPASLRLIRLIRLDHPVIRPSYTTRTLRLLLRTTRPSYTTRTSSIQKYIWFSIELIYLEVIE
jgi:hypothetical protein